MVAFSFSFAFGFSKTNVVEVALGLLKQRLAVEVAFGFSKETPRYTQAAGAPTKKPRCA
jgi:hypothetical protein